MKKIDLSLYALGLAIIAICISLTMVFGSSFGLWDPILGFSASREYNDLIGYIVVSIALLSFIIAIVKKRTYYKSIIALILGLGILTPNIISFFKPAVDYPPIHDISTDTLTPPEFVILQDDRAGAKNTLMYGGPAIAAQQTAAFPDIDSIISPLSPSSAFEKAFNIAETMEWQKVVSNLETLHYEGTANTPYFNFSDDIVIRVVAYQGGSKIDIRSVSRIGRGDRGVNAKRIRRFIEKFTH